MRVSMSDIKVWKVDGAGQNRAEALKKRPHMRHQISIGPKNSDRTFEVTFEALRFHHAIRAHTATGL